MSQPSNPKNISVQFLKGVGPRLSTILEQKGIKTVEDLFFELPIRYIDFRQVQSLSQLQPGKDKCVIAEVVAHSSRPMGRSRRKMHEMTLSDGHGLVTVVWFQFSEKYIQKKYPVGKKLLLMGECQFFGNRKQFVHPDIEEWDPEDSSLGITPVYSLTEGLHQKTIRKIMTAALDFHLDQLEESPGTIRGEGVEKICLKDALLNIHSPPLDSDIALFNEGRSIWHKRVIYDEIFYLQLGLGLKKKGYKKENAPVLANGQKLIERCQKMLPFELTSAQKTSLSEILSDIQKGEPMNRLLQGDVGCGKTMVAFMAALMAIGSGYQAALMAPTEVLSVQHHTTLLPLAVKLGIKIDVLTSATKKEDRERILADLENGKTQLIIGTHAIIQGEIAFHRLGLAIIDEQHRFGVMQRAAIRAKGIPQSYVPHILVMTATPIPRTLSMTVFGDLDISLIGEMPKDRKPIITHLLNEKKRASSYEFIKMQLDKGRQAYVILPLVEASEKMDLKDATSHCEELKNQFPGIHLGLLHGRQNSAEQKEIMDAFKRNDIQILVATTVVEVGVDVPNATVIMIEHAERFGLSQLHQLRGRVGRGQEQSYCLLMAGYARSDEAKTRLEAMVKSNDGFYLAEEDLKIRGPGDFLGTRQSGLPTLHLSSYMGDTRLLDKAKKRVEEIMEIDPTLKFPEHERMRSILSSRWEGKLNLAETA